MSKCGKPCQTYSRVVGYFAPVENWNRGKKAEWNDRKAYVIEGRACPHIKIKDKIEKQT